MAGFGAKVKLSVDRSTAAKQEFNDQINGLVKQIKISNKFVVLQKDMDRVRTSAQTMLNKSPIKITNIDCSQAVTKLRKDLQNVINSLSIKNGVSITGLVDPTGAGTIATQIDNIADAAARGQGEVNRFNAQMSVLKETMSSLATAYKSVLPGGKNAITDTAQLDALTQRYTALKQNIEEIRSANSIASKEKMAALQNEAVAIQNEIAKINQERVAHEQNAAAAKQAEKAKKADADASKKAQEEYYSLLEKINNLIVQTKKNIDSWTASKTGKTSGEYENLERYVNDLEDLKTRLLSSGEASDEFRERFVKVKSSISSSSTVIKEAGENTKTFTDRVGGLAAKFTSWLTISQVIMQVYRAMKEMVHVVAEVDAAMTELRKVTDETEATYSKFLDTAAVRAKAIGATISDTVNATADFARLGHSIADASVLADAAIIYKNVGDGIEDINQASESIISTMQAFGVEATDVMTIVDKFNIIGNKFAISSTGIGEALLNSASALAAAGNTLDESIALITAANEVIQNPEKVGTAMKTMSMYIRAAKTEAEEAGIATDGMANSVSELREEILALTGNKVDIMLDENTFKSTVQIMRELSTVWDDLTDISRTNITELIGGGVRNANVISALINNFETVEEVLVTAADSAGSALAENEKYLDSIAGKVSTFKATFQELAVTAIDSEVVKGIVDMGTALLNVLVTVADVVDALGGLKTVLLTLASAFLVAKGGLIAYKVALFAVAAAEKVITFFTGIKNAILSISSIIPSAIAAWRSYAAGVVSANTAIQASIPVIGLVLAAITAVVTAISLFSDKTEEAEVSIESLKSDFDNLSEKINNTASEFRSLRDSASEVIPRFAELSRGVSALGENVSLTDEEYAEFVSLNNKIAEMFPELNLGMDSNGNAMLTLSYSADTLTDSLWKMVEAQRAAANAALAETMPELMENISSQMGVYNEQIDTVRESTEDALALMQKKATGSYDFKINTTSTDPDKIMRFNDEFYEYIEMLNKHGIEYEIKRAAPASTWYDVVIADQEEAERILREAMDKQINSIENQMGVTWKELNSVVNAWAQSNPLYDALSEPMQDIAQYMIAGIDFSTLGLETAEGVQNYVQGSIISPLFNAGDDVKAAFAKITDWQDMLKSGDISKDEFIQNIEGAFDALFETMSPEAVEEFKRYFVSGLNAMGISGENFAVVLDGLIAEWGNFGAAASSVVPSLASLKDTISDLSSAYDILATAQEEMSAGGGLSEKTISSLLAINEEYLDYLYLEKDVLDDQITYVKLNTDAWKENANAKIKSDMAALEDEIYALIEENDLLEDRNELLASQPESTTNTEEIEANNKAIAENTRLIEENQGKLALYSSIYGSITGDMSAYTAALNNFENIANVIDSVATSYAGLANLQNAVADGFTFSLDKILEYAKAYPEILNNATVTADGELALNEAVVNSFIEGQKAKLNAQIDAQIAELEADKAVLEAKKEFATAQLELAKAAINGESEMTTEFAINRLNMGNALVEALIAMGIEEATAFKLATEAMAGNEEEFARVATECFENVDENSAKAAYNMAQGFFVNSQNSVISISEIARAAQNAARAIQGMINGYVDGSTTTFNGADGVYTGGYGFEGVDASFDGVDYDGYEYKTASLDKYIADLELDISDYTDAIANIEGQIATLEALRNTPFESFKNLVDNASSIVGEKTNDKIEQEQKEAEKAAEEAKKAEEEKKKLVEEYIAAIDEYYMALKRLEEVQKRRVSLEKKLEHTEDLSEKIFLSSGLIDVYKEEAEAERNLMAAKQATISANVGALRGLGFQVSYDPKTNELYIKNLEHLNELTANSAGEYETLQEATNALRKETEDLIETTEQLNQDNIDAAENIEDLGYEILETKNNIIDYIEEIYDKQVESYQKIIDLRKELIESAKDEYDYEADIAEKVKEIADLQSRIDQLALDDSRSAQAERASLMQELAEKQQELADTQGDHATDSQLDALDKMAEDYEQQRADEIEIMRNTVTESEELWNAFYQTILGNTAIVGASVDEHIANAWIRAAQAVNDYSAAMSGISSGGVVINSIPKYHTGGVVDEANVGKDETLALLEKGEVVLNDGKQQTLYKIIDFQEELSKRLGTVIGSLVLPDITGSIRSLVGDAVNNITEGSQSLVFEPHIQVEINHSGTMNDTDAKSYGEKIADTAIEKLYSAFERRGISSARASRLKP